MMGEEILWREVLSLALEEAKSGVRSSAMDKPAKIKATQQARQWITQPNPDFDEVCFLAGYDPEAIRAGMIKQLNSCPSVEDLFKPENIHLRRKGRSERKLTCDGETLTLSEWSKRFGISVNLIDGRIRQGWPPERAVSQPSGIKGRKRGVVTNFVGAIGTGGGRAAQDSSKITFQGIA